jgi:hypothetical protein
MGCVLGEGLPRELRYLLSEREALKEFIMTGGEDVANSVLELLSLVVK